MKKTLLTIAVLLINLVVFAQVEKNAKDRSRFGIKAGPNYSTVFNGSDEKFKPKVGFNIGGFYNTISGKKLTLPIEIMYVKYSTSSTYNSISAHNTYDFSAINMNVMFNYFVNKHFYVEGGMVGGLYINGSSTYKEKNTKFDLIEGDYLMPADVSLGAGIGYELTNRAFFNLRSNYGLLPLFIEDDNSAHLFSTVFNIGYTF